MARRHNPEKLDFKGRSYKKRSKRIQKMVDEMVRDEVDAEMDDGPRYALECMIREGRKGYDQMTDDEVVEQYKEPFIDEMKYMSNEWTVFLAEEGEAAARERFRDVRAELKQLGEIVANKYPDGKKI